MHNAKDGNLVAPTPADNLLTKDCVGCHSSTSGETIVDFNGTRIPIVYNTGGYPSAPLAGGNFYHVSLGGAANDVYGHNVYGISGADANLDKAPGATTGTTDGSCANSCHVSLADNTDWTSPWFSYGRNGCTGCHQAYRHHGTDPPPGQPETLASGWYRFLGGHRDMVDNYHVEGIEDPDWEQAPSASRHNHYTGVGEYYSASSDLKEHPTITAFCNGCHKNFHIWNGGYPDNTGPWLLHPTDVYLPETGEYAAYDPVNDYDPQVPVAWVNPSAPARNQAVVTCLSCHRAHGSQYPDMLRWDYSKMTLGGGEAAGTGCFRCHSAKDD